MKKILVLSLLFITLLLGSGVISRTLADDNHDHHSGDQHDDHHDHGDHKDDHDHVSDCDHDGDPTDPTEATECATPTPIPTPINTGDCDHDGDPTDLTEATECATPTPTPTPTVVPTPTPTPAPTATPNPSAGSQSQMGIDGTICANTNFGTWMIVKRDGNPVAGVNVKFVYNNEAKFAKTESNGRAGVDYGYAQDGDVQVIPDSGFPSQSQHISKAPDTQCANIATMTTTTKPTGSVLGASTMASTGVIEDTLANMVGLMGAALTAAGSFLYVKKNR